MDQTPKEVFLKLNCLKCPKICSIIKVRKKGTCISPYYFKDSSFVEKYFEGFVCLFNKLSFYLSLKLRLVSCRHQIQASNILNWSLKREMDLLNIFNSVHKIQILYIGCKDFNSNILLLEIE